jgi:hypothetical protein
MTCAAASRGELLYAAADNGSMYEIPPPRRKPTHGLSRSSDVSSRRLDEQLEFNRGYFARQGERRGDGAGGARSSARHLAGGTTEVCTCRAVATDEGRELGPALVTLMKWGDRYYPTPAGPPRLTVRAGCAGRVDEALRCERCHQRVDFADLELAPGPGLAHT